MRTHKNWYSKYHKLKTQIVGTTYELIQNKVLSKFHRKENIQAISSNVIEDSFENLSNSPFLPRVKTRVRRFSSSEKPLELFQKRQLIPKNRRVDWTRGRFSGEIQRITINEGIILSKTFLTPSGSLITVKRSELGWLVNFL